LNTASLVSTTVTDINVKNLSV